MISVCKDTPAPREDTVHGAGEADHESLHAADQGLAAVCLDEEVQVIALYGEVHQAEAVV